MKEDSGVTESSRKTILCEEMTKRCENYFISKREK